MSDTTKIEWCDHTFNPWRGCTKVAAGCKHCYAETMSRRNPKVLGVWGDDGTRVVAAEAYWRKPSRWAREARRQSDCEHFSSHGVPELGERYWRCDECGALLRCDPVGGRAGLETTTEIRPRVFCGSLMDVFEDRRELDAHRARLFKLIEATPELDWLLLTKRPGDGGPMLAGFSGSDMPQNLWVGVSVACVDDLPNIEALRRIPAAVRFVSLEPQIKHVGSPDLSGIDWLIQGCESGPGRRFFANTWAWDVRDECRRQGVAYFLKQIQFGPDRRVSSDPAEWPEGLRVREFPEVAS